MTTFDDPLADAPEACRALRGLAHATRTVPDLIDRQAVVAAAAWHRSRIEPASVGSRRRTWRPGTGGVRVPRW